MNCQVPVTIIVFNRYKEALQLYKYLQVIKPVKLFIISDGPRPKVPGEKEAVQKVRKLFEKINWDCEIYKNYSEENMGCDDRIPDGLSWVFTHVEYSIILEDDCIPDIYFHQFCQELLEKYRYDNDVMFISGTNLAGQVTIKESYFFSYHSSTWGWATWRRAWAKYQATQEYWNYVNEKNQLNEIFDKKTADFFKNSVNHHFSQGIYPWDYLWWSCCLYSKGISVTPAVNLVTNIGFSRNATHTEEKPGKYQGKTYPISFPLVHTDNKDIKVKYGKMWRKMISTPLTVRFRRKIKTLLCSEAQS
jgi:hypothetical protein